MSNLSERELNKLILQTGFPLITKGYNQRIKQHFLSPEGKLIISYEYFINKVAEYPGIGRRGIMELAKKKFGIEVDEHSMRAPVLFFTRLKAIRFLKYPGRTTTSKYYAVEGYQEIFQKAVIKAEKKVKRVKQKRQRIIQKIKQKSFERNYQKKVEKREQTTTRMDFAKSIGYQRLSQALDDMGSWEFERRYQRLSS
jgi:hypothetical protein